MDQLTNTTTNAAIIPEIWSQNYRDTLRAELAFLDPGVVDNSYSSDIQALGDIVNISQIPDFDEAVELPEGAAGSADSISINGQQIVINKRSYKDALITKRSQLQSLPFMDELRDRMIYSIRKRMQAVIVAASVPAAGNQISYDSGTTLALADILQVKEKLDSLNVPKENRTMTLGAAQENDLFNITGFQSSDFVLHPNAGSPLQTGMNVTLLLGFMPKYTTVVSTTAYFFHRSYLTMAIQDQLNISMYDVGGQGIRGTRVNADTLYGVKLLDNTRIATLS